MAMPRLSSILKWIGLYLLANIIGGGLAFILGVQQYGAPMAAAILVVMIIVAWRLNRKQSLR